MKLRKLNSGGMGLVEILVIISMVVVVAVAGYIVYDDNHNNVAHAGGWTTVGTGKYCLTVTSDSTCTSSASYTAKMCRYTDSLTGKRYVKGAAIADGQFPAKSQATITDYFGTPVSENTLRSRSSIVLAAPNKVINIPYQILPDNSPSGHYYFNMLVTLDFWSSGPNYAPAYPGEILFGALDTCT